MNNWRRLFTFLWIFLCIASIFIGCKKSGGDIANGTHSSNDALLMKGVKYDPPVTLTTVRNIAGALQFKNGETIDDNVHYRWAKDKLGIQIKNLWSVSEANNGYTTKLKLVLSANEEMPDIVVVKSSDSDSAQMLQELIDSGKFQEVGPLFDKYASASWKKAMNEDATAWYPFTRDGNKMAIPNLDYAYNLDPQLWLRGDWLKKLNLKTPTTIAELETVMDAFVNQDPNGDGKKGTFALSATLKDDLNTLFGDLGWVFGAYGSLPNQWNKAEDGSLVYGSIQPEIKKGLAKLKEWVNKGYIPQGAGTWDGLKAAELMNEGKAGIYVGPYWTDIYPLGDLKNKVPSAELTVAGIPTGPTGQAMRHGTTVYDGAILINKNMKHPEIFFTYMNYLFNHQADPVVSGEFENGWAEGYDWAKVNGKVTTATDKIPGGGVKVFYYPINNWGARIPSQNSAALNKFGTTGEADTPFEKFWSSYATPLEVTASVELLKQKDRSFNDQFTGGQTATMLDKWEFLKKLERETFSKIIYGKDTLDSFDDFIAKWRANGGDQITKEVNDWYKSVTRK